LRHEIAPNTPTSPVPGSLCAPRDADL
jgi:hypothetical protein